MPWKLSTPSLIKHRSWRGNKDILWWSIPSPWWQNTLLIQDAIVVHARPPVRIRSKTSRWGTSKGQGTAQVQIMRFYSQLCSLVNVFIQSRSARSGVDRLVSGEQAMPRTRLSLWLWVTLSVLLQYGANRWWEKRTCSGFSGTWQTCVFGYDISISTVLSGYIDIDIYRYRYNSLPLKLISRLIST
jgi:hypothetical protein